MGNGLDPLQHDDSVSGRTRQNVRIQGRLLRLTRQAAALQIHDPATPLRLSEALDEVVIHSAGLPAYCGKAVVTSLVDAGSHLVCELELDPSQVGGDFLAAAPEAGRLADMEVFLTTLEHELRIREDFKVAVADIQTTLVLLQRWTEHLELGEKHAESADRERWLGRTQEALGPSVIRLLNEMFARYEAAAARVPREDLPAHRTHVQRALHPLVLCAPFAHRTYHKPLGYAGDYEMVNMMLGSPGCGANLFARLFNVWLLSQDTAAAHRNRIAWLTHRLTDTAAAAARAGRRARIYNLGCGPCHEIRAFLENSLLSSQVDFILADFDAQALDHARQSLRALALQHARRPRLTFVRSSIRELLRESLPSGGILGGDEPFDLVYCAGLFDYLTDTVCRQFVGLGCRSLRPGGSFVCTNVAPQNPNRGSMELILDWHLYYRDAAQMRHLLPTDLAGSTQQVETELTGSNLFLEITPRDVC